MTHIPNIPGAVYVGGFFFQPQAPVDTGLKVE